MCEETNKSGWAEFSDYCADQMQMQPQERQFLQTVLERAQSYLEIGSGYSTLWCSQYVNRVVSVETRRQWYEQVSDLLRRWGIENVELHHFPPEGCAYDERGEEKWTNKSRLDYGRTEEFAGYLERIDRLLEQNDFDVVLVDGNVRRQVVELLVRRNFAGVVLLHDVEPRRSHLNDPILRMPQVRLIRQAGTLAELAIAPYRLEVGASRTVPGWIVTNKDELDVTEQADWRRHFSRGSLRVIFAEHVLEHLDSEQVRRFFENAYEYLCENGVIRLAVPDGLHGSAWYRELCRPGGLDVGSDDHRQFFTCRNIRQYFDPEKYELRLLEWWDEEGFHRADYKNDQWAGLVSRSSENYSGRINTSPQLRGLLYDSTPERLRGEYSKRGITYTSLIFELARKPIRLSAEVIEEPPVRTQAETLQKVIGFCVTGRDVELEFPFRRHFPWLRFEKLRIGRWFVHLWGHGSFEPFVIHKDGVTIIAGYTRRELEMLGADRPENRAVFIRIKDEQLQVENDAVGSFMVFYGRGEDNVCISSVQELVLQCIGRSDPEPTNLVQYLLVGHLTGEQTIYPHIFTMLANSRLVFSGDKFETFGCEPLQFRTLKEPVAELYEATLETIRRYSRDYDKVFLPLSGGYDSRLLAACVEAPDRVVARTFDYSYPVEFGYEVARARLAAAAAGIRDWQCVDLGCDYIADYGRRWFDIFGTSHHLHGMYWLCFFEKVFGGLDRPIPTLSGFIGDVLAGHHLHLFHKVCGEEPAGKFRKSQLQGPAGFGEQELERLLNFEIQSLLPEIYGRWQEQWEQAEGDEYQKFILNLARGKGRTNVSYLCTLADLYGAAVTPFTDRRYIETVLSLPYGLLLNRAAQEAIFSRYLPAFRPDESRLPKYRHNLNFLCMHKRGLENIFPVVRDGNIQPHRFFRTEAVCGLVSDFNAEAHSATLLNGAESIRCLHQLAVMQPLYYAQQDSTGIEAGEDDGALGRLVEAPAREPAALEAEPSWKEQVAEQLVGNGKTIFDEGNVCDAMVCFMEAYELSPECADEICARTVGCLNKAGLADARKAAEQMLAVRPGHKGAQTVLQYLEQCATDYRLFREGLRRLAGGDPGGALQNFDDVASMLPGLENLQFARATALAQVGRIGQAGDACKAELNRRPGHEQARKLLLRIEEAISRSESLPEEPLCRM